MKNQTAKLSRLDIPGGGECLSERDIFAAAVKQWRQRLGYCSIFAAIPAILATHVTEARSDEVKRTEAVVPGRGLRLLDRLSVNRSNPALLKRQSEFRLPHQKGNFAMVTTFAGVDDCPGRAIPGGNYTAAAPYTDSGDTTGANNTVNRLNYYYYYTFDASGPDHVYSFMLTGRGPNPQIEVSTTSGTYRPLVYVVEGGYAGACPAVSGSSAYAWVASDSRWVNGSSTATLNLNQVNFLPLNVPLYLFVDSARNDATGAGPYSIRMQDVTIASAACPNPIDCPEFFVRQHYFDFLGREPDSPGQGFWTGNITKCTDPSLRPAAQTEAECIDTQKVTTSAAFFLSPEFQYTGYFVYRLYKGSLIQNGAGRVPTYQEFSRDLWDLGRGIIQNNQVSAAAIEQNKKTFAEAFIRRAEFRSIYDSLANFDYVERLFQTTGVSVSTQEKQALVQGLNNQTETRASVLQKVVDGTVVIAEGNQQVTTSYGQAFYQKEFNSAFVLMEYFAYLRRDPDAAGYQHWLDKLNLYGNYLDAEMVRSFIASPEYRARFGQP
jgi:hypothetical protein